MRVSSGCRARCDVSDPNDHLAALDLRQIQFEKVRPLDGLLLGIGATTSAENAIAAINVRNGSLVVRCAAPSGPSNGA